MGNTDIIQKLTDAEVQSLFDAFEERVDACAQDVLEKPARKSRKFPGFSTPEEDLSEEKAHALKDYIRAYTHAYHASGGRFPKPKDLAFNSASSVRDITRQQQKLPENLKTYRFKQWAEMPISDAKHVKTLFGDALEKDGPQQGRMYFKINVPVVPDSVKEQLEKDGHYEVISNKEVREVSESGRTKKISTVLATQFKFSRTPEESERIRSLQKEHSLFLSHLSGEDVVLVASVRPEDIVRCSTARPNMHSCLAEESRHGTEHNRWLPHMVQEGAVVFYLANADDPHIERPYARVVSKPAHKIAGDETILVADNVYGVRSQGFIDAVMQTCQQINKDRSGSFEVAKNTAPNVGYMVQATPDGSYNFSARKFLKDKVTLDPNAIQCYLTPDAREGHISAEDLLTLTCTPFEKGGESLYAEDDFVINDLPLKQLPNMSNVIAPGFRLSNTDISVLDLSKLPEAPGLTVEDNHKLEEVSGRVGNCTVRLGKNTALTDIDADFSEGGRLGIQKSPLLSGVALRGQVSSLRIDRADGIDTLKLKRPPEKLEISGLNRPPKTYTDTPENATRLEELMEEQLGFPCPVVASGHHKSDPTQRPTQNAAEISPEPK